VRCATPIRCWIIGHVTVDDAPCLRDRVHPADVGKVVGGGLIGMAWIWFLVVMLSASVSAHTVEELDVWRADWTVRVQDAGGLSADLLAEWVDMRDRHGCDWPGTTCIVLPEHHRISLPPPTSVEHWRPLVSLHFPPEHVDAALRVLSCESQGNPVAQHPYSKASGLFQAMPQWYTGAGWFEPSPFGPFDPFDPAENVRFAAWLSKGGSDWSHWVCRP